MQYSRILVIIIQESRMLRSRILDPSYQDPRSIPEGSVPTPPSLAADFSRILDQTGPRLLQNPRSFLQYTHQLSMDAGHCTLDQGPWIHRPRPRICAIPWPQLIMNNPTALNEKIDQLSSPSPRLITKKKRESIRGGSR